MARHEDPRDDPEHAFAAFVHCAGKGLLSPYVRHAVGTIRGSTEVHRTGVDESELSTFANLGFDNRGQDDERHGFTVA
jgi:hypothetical protein